ncbi:hypothetical protein SCLCIDRAFT_1214480 [Scleroderma citrinum Foug A]|uniref:Uncharacterized protein n=1 Tax=Scleroderma citrinum Foug A TaxID=1036808 RepID=A0A0C3AE22_9AGAM|nr:hypothetical protein SCLCIDRAFT_1214480 [Scleroderma citrinum Foug A]
MSPAHIPVLTHLSVRKGSPKKRDSRVTWRLGGDTVGSVNRNVRKEQQGGDTEETDHFDGSKRRTV